MAMGTTAKPGISIPRPIAVGEGTQRASFGFPSRRVSTTPRTSAIIRACSALAGKAPNPFERSSAKPAHFTLTGEERPVSPPTPYFARTSG